MGNTFTLPVDSKGWHISRHTIGPMIVRIIDESTQHADREALAEWRQLFEVTVRRHWRPAIVGRDSEPGRALRPRERRNHARKPAAAGTRADRRYSVFASA
jgi:hypothetical protein